MKLKIKPAPFRFQPFSKKQKQVLTWWHKDSPVRHLDGIICDGSIRAGKTVSMALSYIMWAMDTFDGENLGMAGKTIGSLRRNVVGPLKRMLKSRGYKVQDHRSDNMLTIVHRGKTNFFYLFGGKDESSQDLIQGITLAGMFFDEVALMPQSFVNQATGRCSIAGSKFWFNCNPAGPMHWFKLDWIDKKKEKRMLHVHFMMDDNLSLDEGTKQRYYRMYSGVFYKRFILGLWVLAEGIVYDMFDEAKHTVDPEQRQYEKYFVSVDYGTQNATVFLLWGMHQGTWYCVEEYYYSGREKGVQKTDEEYCNDLEALVGDRKIQFIIIDPSAASLIAAIRKRNKFRVKKAKNDVQEGIQNTASALQLKKIRFNRSCKQTLKEFFSYVWDEKAVEKGKEIPLKENDHCMDAVRYFVNTIVMKRGIGILK